MANNILETVYGLGDDDTIKSLKRIDKVVGKYETEKKKEENKEQIERKQDKLHENRLIQLKKRHKADKPKVFTDTLKKEKKKHTNDLTNWLLGGALILGGGALAWMNKDKIKEKLEEVGEDIKNELIDSMKEWGESLYNDFEKQLKEQFDKTIKNIKEGPLGGTAPVNPQRYNPGDVIREKINRTIDHLKGRKQTSPDAIELENIRNAADIQHHEYSILSTFGIGGEHSKELRDFYKNALTNINDLDKDIEQDDNMRAQLEEIELKLKDDDLSKKELTRLEKKVKNLVKNISNNQIHIKNGKEALKKLAANELKLKAAENIRQGRDPATSRQIFKGSQYAGYQKGGRLGQKFRKGNGAPTEYLMNPGVDPQKRQKGGKIFLHWAASEYDYSSPSYHATVQGDGSVKKERDYNSFGGGHTSERNSEGIGLSLAAMKGATSNDFGSFPVKKNQYESLAKLTASILTSWGQGPSYVNEKNVPTHAEAGRQGDSMGNYGPVPWGGSGDRWDLWMLNQGDTPGSGGPKIRNMIKSYMGSGDFELETTDGEGHSVPNMPAPKRQKTFMEKIQEAFGALGNVGIFAGTVLKGIGGFLLEKLGIDLSGMFSMFNMGQPEQKQEGGLIKGNAKDIYDRLITGGMSIPASRGILANIGVETGYTYDPKTKQGNDGPGRGLVQWEKGGRYDTDRINLVDFAKSKGTAWDDLNTQVDFILHEMNTHPEYMRLKPKLNAAKSTKDATELFLRDYEKAGTPHTDRRHKVGNQLDQLGWKGPAKVGSKVGPAKVGTGNKLLDMFMGKQSGGMITPSRSTTSNHTNFQQNQQTFNQSRGAGKTQVVVVRRRAPQQPIQLPTPAPPQGILPSGGVNNIASINDMYSVVGMS